MNRHGLILLNKRHCHLLAPDIWPNEESAKRHIIDVNPQAHETTFRYKLSGTGQAENIAIFDKTPNEQEASTIIAQKTGREIRELHFLEGLGSCQRQSNIAGHLSR